MINGDMNNMINKKGLTMNYIITIIILIVSFGIIALFFTIYGFGGEVDKEACHFSVIQKATIPDVGGTDIIELPLDCETEKICISESRNGNCDNYFKGEKYVTKQVSKDILKKQEEIKKIFADSFYDCWWMMGQGKLQVFSRGGGDSKDCVLCTRIAFDDELINGLSNKKINGLTKYMLETQAPNSKKTYWQYIRNTDSNFVPNYNEAEDFIDLRTNPQKVILFAEGVGGALDDWLTVGTATGVGAITGGMLAGAALGSIVPVAGTVVGAGIGAFVGYLGSTEAVDAINKWMDDDIPIAIVGLRDYNFENLKSLSCTSFEG